MITQILTYLKLKTPIGQVTQRKAISERMILVEPYLLIVMPWCDPLLLLWAGFNDLLLGQRIQQK